MFIHTSDGNVIIFVEKNALNAAKEKSQAEHLNYESVDLFLKKKSTEES